MNMRLADVEDVLERIERTVWDDALAEAMRDRVEDLSLSDSGKVYGPVEFGEPRQMSRKRRLDIGWTDHAEYRSELRDVDPGKVNDSVTKVMRDRLRKQRTRGKEKLKVPGGTAVVDYDLRGKPADADVVTVWASESGRRAGWRDVAREVPGWALDWMRRARRRFSDEVLRVSVAIAFGGVETTGATIEKVSRRMGVELGADEIVHVLHAVEEVVEMAHGLSASDERPDGVAREPLRLAREALGSELGSRGVINGTDEGEWWLGEPRGDWWLLYGMESSRHPERGSVAGATERHPGFLKALGGIVRRHPEASSWELAFDGPFVPVAELLGRGSGPGVRWASVVFYHGTSERAWEQIRRQGLRPRSGTNVEPAYGIGVGAEPGRVDAVYLTTQTGMARWAARDAARMTGGAPVVLRVRGIDGDKARADGDSGEATAEASLGRMGSIAYVGDVPASKVELHEVLRDRRWRKEAGRRGHVLRIAPGGGNDSKEESEMDGTKIARELVGAARELTARGEMVERDYLPREALPYLDERDEAYQFTERGRLSMYADGRKTVVVFFKMEFMAVFEYGGAGVTRMLKADPVVMADYFRTVL